MMVRMYRLGNGQSLDRLTWSRLVSEISDVALVLELSEVFSFGRGQSSPGILFQNLTLQRRPVFVSQSLVWFLTLSIWLLNLCKSNLKPDECL